MSGRGAGGHLHAGRVHAVSASHRELTRRLREVNERLVISSIREQELAEAAEERRAELSALLGALSEGVVIATSVGEIVMTNHAALRILGLPSAAAAAVLEEEVTGGPALFEVDETPLSRERRPLRRALGGESFDDFAILVARADGQTRRVMTSGTSIGETEHPSLAIVVLRDVTEVWRLEQQREEYLALISHDLRGPLTAIRLVARSLRDATEEGRFDGRVVDRIDRIEKNATRMEAMIQQLLDATSLEHHASRLERTPCDLSALVADVVAPMDEGRRARVVVDGDHAPCEVLGDAPSLVRAISNLVGNALKYSAGVVSVRVARRGAFAAVEVADTGGGIAASEVPMLFHRYFRASTAPHGGGLGLGLYIVRLIAEAHGGSVSVETRLGAGSTFSLVLPLHERET